MALPDTLTNNLVSPSNKLQQCHASQNHNIKPYPFNITMARIEEEEVEVDGMDGDSDTGSVPLVEVADGDKEV